MLVSLQRWSSHRSPCSSALKSTASSFVDDAMSIALFRASGCFGNAKARFTGPASCWTHRPLNRWSYSQQLGSLENEDRVFEDDCCGVENLSTMEMISDKEAA